MTEQFSIKNITYFKIKYIPQIRISHQMMFDR